MHLMSGFGNLPGSGKDGTGFHAAAAESAVEHSRADAELLRHVIDELSALLRRAVEGMLDRCGVASRHLREQRLGVVGVGTDHGGILTGGSLDGQTGVVAMVEGIGNVRAGSDGTLHILLSGG